MPPLTTEQLAVAREILDGAPVCRGELAVSAVRELQPVVTILSEYLDESGKSNKCYILDARAGAGKSAVAVAILRENARRGGSSVFCAPQHSAVDAFRPKLKEEWGMPDQVYEPRWNVRVGCMYQKGFFYPNFKGDYELRGALSRKTTREARQLIVVDEAGLMDLALTLRLLQLFDGREMNVTVVYMGDSSQLEPVGSKDHGGLRPPIFAYYKSRTFQGSNRFCLSMKKNMRAANTPLKFQTVLSNLYNTINRILDFEFVGSTPEERPPAPRGEHLRDQLAEELGECTNVEMFAGGPTEDAAVSAIKKLDTSSFFYIAYTNKRVDHVARLTAAHLDCRESELGFRARKIFPMYTDSGVELVNRNTEIHASNECERKVEKDHVMYSSVRVPCYNTTGYMAACVATSNKAALELQQKHRLIADACDACADCGNAREFGGGPDFLKKHNLCSLHAKMRNKVNPGFIRDKRFGTLYYCQGKTVDAIVIDVPEIIRTYKMIRLMNSKKRKRGPVRVEMEPIMTTDVKSSCKIEKYKSLGKLYKKFKWAVVKRVNCPIEAVEQHIPSLKVLRGLYVALTRTRDKVLLVSRPKAKKKSRKKK